MKRTNVPKRRAERIEKRVNMDKARATSRLVELKGTTYDVRKLCLMVKNVGGHAEVAMPRWFCRSVKRWVVTSSDCRKQGNQVELSSLPRDTVSLLRGEGRQGGWTTWGPVGGQGAHYQSGDMDPGTHQRTPPADDFQPRMYIQRYQVRSCSSP